MWARDSEGPLMSTIAQAIPSDTPELFEEIRFTTRDGLSLYARHYRARHGGKERRPVLCLPGLTRNSRDFHTVAVALSQNDGGNARDVYTLDSRGRGASSRDKDWRNYTVPVEMHDAIDFLIRCDLTDVGILGTSRGGLIAMVLGAVQPGMIGAVVLNDIGPVVERAGLLRIAGYVGKTPAPTSWAHAGEIVRQVNERQFPNRTAEQWIAFARQLYNEKDGRPVASYDARIARSLGALDGPMPMLWPQFAALSRVPVMVIRGQNSDLLSAATIAEMGRRHPALRVHVVADEGHAPLLQDAPTIAAIAQFLSASDGKRSAAA
jgi:pimeloyl-ACP methyl ester carboxylesterase